VNVVQENAIDNVYASKPKGMCVMMLDCRSVAENLPWCPIIKSGFFA